MPLNFPFEESKFESMQIIPSAVSENRIKIMILHEIWEQSVQDWSSYPTQQMKNAQLLPATLTYWREYPRSPSFSVSKDFIIESNDNFESIVLCSIAQ